MSNQGFNGNQHTFDKKEPYGRLHSSVSKDRLKELDALVKKWACKTRTAAIEALIEAAYRTEFPGKKGAKR